MEIKKITGTEFDVQSETDPKKKPYRVDMEGSPFCNCYSFLHPKPNQVGCKHIKAVDAFIKSPSDVTDNVVSFKNGNDGTSDEYEPLSKAIDKGVKQAEETQKEKLPKTKKEVRKQPDSDLVHGKKRYIVPDKYIVELKNKKNEVIGHAIRYNGLLDAGHYYGFKSLIPEILQYPSEENKNVCYCKATLISDDGKIYVAHSEASPKNVSYMVAGFILTMGDTRAKGRALRDFTNVGMVCFEEIGEQDDESKNGIKKSNNNGYKQELVDTKTPLLKREIIKQLIKFEIIASCTCETPEKCDHEKKIEFNKLGGFSLDRLQEIVNMFLNEEIKTKKVYELVLKY